MSIRKRFGEIFGVEDGLEDERKRFVERVNQAIFHRIDTERPVSWEFNYPELFRAVCFELGINAHTIPPRRRMLTTNEPLPAEIRTLTDGTFTATLVVLCAMYQHLAEKGPYESQEWLSQEIEKVLSRCTCDIGVRWKEGFFYLAGAEELDKPLIEDALTWLRDYPSEEKDYRAALHHYTARDSLADVVTNCYSAVEGLARSVLGNRKTLDKNKDELLAKIGLSNGWKSLMANYINYAHDYRHSSETRHTITKQEAEAYLYMTGLIIRLTIESGLAT